MKKRLKQIFIATALTTMIMGARCSIECCDSDAKYVSRTEDIIASTRTIRETSTPTPTPTPTIESLGIFKITAYCSCEKCCGQWANVRENDVVYGSIGEELTANYSIAVDPDVIPYGSVVLINGNEYVAHDTGGAIRDNRIDIYMTSHAEALEWGVQEIEVFKEVK